MSNEDKLREETMQRTEAMRQAVKIIPMSLLELILKPKAYKRLDSFLKGKTTVYDEMIDDDCIMLEDFKDWIRTDFRHDDY